MVTRIACTLALFLATSVVAAEEPLVRKLEQLMQSFDKIERRAGKVMAGDDPVASQERLCHEYWRVWDIADTEAKRLASPARSPAYVPMRRLAVGMEKAKDHCWKALSAFHAGDEKTMVKEVKVAVTLHGNLTPPH